MVATVQQRCGISLGQSKADHGLQTTAEDVSGFLESWLLAPGFVHRSIVQRIMKSDCLLLSRARENAGAQRNTARAFRSNISPIGKGREALPGETGILWIKSRRRPTLRESL